MPAVLFSIYGTVTHVLTPQSREVQLLTVLDLCHFTHALIAKDNNTRENNVLDLCHFTHALTILITSFLQFVFSTYVISPIHLLFGGGSTTRTWFSTCVISPIHLLVYFVIISILINDYFKIVYY